ncbi:hypothetical protein BJ878DRAFT_480575 [Calycina marina]|uniref:ATP phosphoribosyltransferase n=1 Tax=Calycina marina TaxID=1763456 RepID=A0A9P7Z2N8_9HELO|nr:hypothetical protein BJ878DRAFT_480575 [Calycina marina]
MPATPIHCMKRNILVFHVPHLSLVASKRAILATGASVIENYIKRCLATSRASQLPSLEGATPKIGTVGMLEEVKKGGSYARTGPLVTCLESRECMIYYYLPSYFQNSTYVNVTVKKQEDKQRGLCVTKGIKNQTQFETESTTTLLTTGRPVHLFALARRRERYPNLQRGYGYNNALNSVLLP